MSKGVLEKTPAECEKILKGAHVRPPDFKKIS